MPSKPLKHLYLDIDTHSNLMQFKAKRKLKTARQAIGELLELAKQEGE